MKKLISRNPILRFKLGKSIIKAEKGLEVTKATPGTTFGDYVRVYRRGNPESGLAWANDNMPDYLDREILVNGYILKPDGSYIEKSVRDEAAKHPLYTNEEIRMINRLAAEKLAKKGYVKDSKGNYVLLNSPLATPSNSLQPPVNTNKPSTPVNNVWLNGYKHDEIDDVRAWLNKLKDYYAPSTFEVDGKWGDNTEAAYLNYLADLASANIYNRMLNNNDNDLSHISRPILQTNTTPNFGYRSTFDYTGSNKAIRDFGFNNYAGLVNFAKANPNNQFARDLQEVLGQVDTWKQDDVEGKMGISGTYRRGINGNYSDIMRYMAREIGKKNAEYDAKYNEYMLSIPYKSNLATPVNNSLPRYWRQKYGNVLNLSYYKKGGLVSRNPVERFKSRGGEGLLNFRKGEV